MENSCTIVSNLGYGVYAYYNVGYATNCIIYYNGSNPYANVFSHCCVPVSAPGPGNFTSAPQLFVDGVHLMANSPCIGAGVNVVTGTDIFGRGWSNPPAVGCAEWQPAPFVTPPQLLLATKGIGFIITNAFADGQPPFTYWWLKDGVVLQNNGHFSATQTASLVAAGVSLADAGNYQLVVSNSYGVVTSAVAALVVHCVNVAGTNPVAPYTNWATAAIDIQDAISAANAGDFVLVTSGLYATGGKSMDGIITNRVTLDKALTVLSVNGFSATAIQGAWDPATTNGPLAVRCAWLTNGATLFGFTLQNGATSSSGSPANQGGGVWCGSSNGLVSNCLLSNNVAIYGGGAAFATVNDSLIINNTAAINGGGAYYATLNNCTVANNYNLNGPGSGGGTYFGTTRNSIVVGNFYYFLGPFEPANYGQPGYTYCCTYPSASGVGNIVVESPSFTDVLYHLPEVSPCRAAGSAMYATGTDLDGELWANPPSIGCHEVIPTNLVGPLSVAIEAPLTNSVVNHNLGFTGTVTGRCSQLNWSFGDGTVTTNANLLVFHEWANPGTYSVACTAYNGSNPGGVTTTASVLISPFVSPLLQSPTLTSNAFQFSFPALANATYFVEFATNLAPPVTWQTLQLIYLATNGPVQIQDGISTNTARFYRVVAE